MFATTLNKLKRLPTRSSQSYLKNREREERKAGVSDQWSISIFRSSILKKSARRMTRQIKSFTYLNPMLCEELILNPNRRVRFFIAGN